MDVTSASVPSADSNKATTQAMSVNSLTNSATARRTDFLPDGPPQGFAGIAAAAAAPPQPIPAADQASPRANAVDQPADPKPADSVNTALHVLFGYIPTEVLTLYVAILAAIHQPNKITQTDWATFYAFLVATPLVVWLVYAAKVGSAQKPLPLSPALWPMWEMTAATVAFVAWAFALPEAPFSQLSWYSSALSGVAVLVASTILGLLAPLLQRPIQAPQT